MKKITRKKMDLFLEKYKTDKKVLDIGSGGSSYDKYFPNRLTFDLDVDRNPEIIGDVHEMPFKDGEFGIILCTEVLEHLKNPRKAISEMKRVLKKNGKLILTTRFIFPIHDAPNDYFRYTKYGLQELFKNWKILKLESESASFETIAVLLQRLIFQANYRTNKIIKGCLLILVNIFLFLNRFIKAEFGNIEKTKEEKDILSSGYYMIIINE